MSESLDWLKPSVWKGGLAAVIFIIALMWSAPELQCCFGGLECGPNRVHYTPPAFFSALFSSPLCCQVCATPTQYWIHIAVAYLVPPLIAYILACGLVYFIQRLRGNKE